MTNAVITAQQGSTQADVGFKNRVINGDFRINQRFGTALQTGITGGANYWLADRFRIGGSALSTGRFSFQTVTDAPAGFVNSGKITVTTSQTPAASDVQVLSQIIEGINVSDFAWGTSGALAVSLSFWVKANLSGQYCVAVRSDNATAAYVATYTITTANTWQYITISIPGCTFGTWGGQSLSTTIGVRLDFNLGTGTSSSTSSVNTWLTADYFRTTSDIQLVQTLGATWQITGVQLEVGTSASGFDYRFYGDELQRCYRYFVRMLAPGQEFYPMMMTGGYVFPSNYYKWITRALPVPMRASPTVTTYPDPNSTASPGQARYFTTNSSGAGNNYVVYGTDSSPTTIKYAVYNEHNAITCYGSGCSFDASAEL